MTKKVAEENLKNLGNELGLTDLQFDENHTCVIEFDEGIAFQGQSSKIDIVIKEELRQTDPKTITHSMEASECH